MSNAQAITDIRKSKQSEIDHLEDKIRENQHNDDTLEKKKEEINKMIQDLNDALEKEKDLHMTEVSDKEREKIQATESLKDDMEKKITETKANLKALNEEQLQTTTRLTILQNHQLTTELEYQSKQTEKLLNKNNKMQEQINSLKRDIDIHKTIEAEMAKKFHKFQKVINNLNQTAKKLEGQLQVIQDKIKKQEQQEDAKTGGRSNEELVNFLEMKLQDIEDQLQETQNNYDALQKEYVEFINRKEKLSAQGDKYK